MIRWLLLLAIPVVAADVPLGAHATIHAQGNGVPAPTFQHFKNGVKVGDGAQYVIPSATSNDAGTYIIHGTNGHGSAVSTPIVVAVLIAPTITREITPAMVNKKGTAVFTSAATGTGVKFRWYKNGKLIPGEVGATLRVTGVKPPDAGMYRVVAYNSVGEDFSESRLILI